MPRVTVKPVSPRRRGTRTGSKSQALVKIISRHGIYESAYKQEKSDIDKAITTLESGKKKDLREKYKKYIKCHA